MKTSTKKVTTLIALMLLASAVILTCRASVPILGIKFYTAKEPGGPEVTVFYRGETVYLKASPPIGGADVEIGVGLYFPPESGLSPIQLLPPTRKVLTGDTTITEYPIPRDAYTGRYSMRVTVRDLKTGRVEENYIPFEVREPYVPPPDTTRPPPQPSIPMELIVGVAIVLASVIAAVAILYKGRAPSVPAGVPSGVPAGVPVGAPGGEGTQVVSPGTVTITGPSGETITVTAFLQAGQKIIPISSLPQTFGRSDFVGVVPEEILRTISRRHFTIGYDYAQGTFVIWDEGSTNGTYLNGVDIRGKGRQPLKDGDIISPANAINLRFSTTRAA